MAQAEVREVLKVEPDRLFSIITCYEEYPVFVEGCTSVQVDRQSSGAVQVVYRVNIMSQDVSYTLNHKEDRNRGRVEWELVESNFFKKNRGYWEIQSAGSGKSDVLYTVEVEFKIPIPGFILNRLVKGSLPNMIRSFEKRANQS